MLTEQETVRTIDALEYHFNQIDADEHEINMSIVAKLKKNKDYREDVLSKMISLRKSNGDVEANHSQGDKLLCELLCELGYSDVVAEFQQMTKWYA